jgi:hypothetical protein
MREAAALMARKIVPSKNHHRLRADMYLNRRSECLKDWMEILALGMSRS